MPKNDLRDTANLQRNMCLLSCIDDHQISPEDYEITGGEVCCAYSDHIKSLPIPWMCQKQTAISHSSAESEIISPDAVLRMDRFPARQFGECVLETSSTKPAEGNLERHTRERAIPSHSHSDNCVFESMDHVPADIPNRSHPIQLHIFEDSAAVVQMINSGRGPNLRHVTRTHRVDLNWSFERVTIDHSILRKYARTNDQLA